MLVLMFPGQGAQVVGMGKELFEKYPEIVKKCDEILDYSIKDLCLKDENNLLGITKYTQVALYVVGVMTYLDYIETNNCKPDYLIGHSLGEYVALYAAGAFDFETGLKIVKKRGELMNQAIGGGMAAVIGLDAERIKTILADQPDNRIDVANYNSKYQTVISGIKEDIIDAEHLFTSEEGFRFYKVLNVSGAFHSRYMQSIQEELYKYILGIEFNELKIPVISNTFAKEYKSEYIREILALQLVSSVRWTDTIRYLMRIEDCTFKELTVGTTLTSLVSRIKREDSPLDYSSEYSDNEIKLLNNIKQKYSKNNLSEACSNNSDVKKITAYTIGNKVFRERYNTKYSYYGGGMYKGISSKEMVVRFGNADILSFYGTGGVKLNEVENNIRFIKEHLAPGKPFGINVVNNPNDPSYEFKLMDIIINNGVSCIEASAFFSVTPALIYYRAKGIKIINGKKELTNHIIAKLSRPEVAAEFLSTPSERLINKLIESGKISVEEAEIIKNYPVADDICVESDSGGHTDAQNAFSVLPTIVRMRNETMTNKGFKDYINVGAAGGIGTPESVVASIMLGADFFVTGSINQCSVEAGTSDIVKDMLQNMNVQDTDYVPAGDMFEYGAKVQVMKKGVFFATRANKLYELYKLYSSIDDLDDKTIDLLENKYFNRKFSDIYKDCIDFYSTEEIEKADKNPKVKMAMIFKWYFGRSTFTAINGDETNRVNFQIPCGPALGAFNQWVKGTELESWKNRNVDKIADLLLSKSAEYLNNKIAALL